MTINECGAADGMRLGKRKSEFTEKNPPHRNFIHQKSHITYLEWNPGRRSGKPAKLSISKFKYFKT
jgi:hypothetical protein